MNRAAWLSRVWWDAPLASAVSALRARGFVVRTLPAAHARRPRAPWRPYVRTSRRQTSARPSPSSRARGRVRSPSPRSPGSRRLLRLPRWNDWVSTCVRKRRTDRRPAAPWSGRPPPAGTAVPPRSSVARHHLGRRSAGHPREAGSAGPGQGPEGPWRREGAREAEGEARGRPGMTGPLLLVTARRAAAPVRRGPPLLR